MPAIAATAEVAPPTGGGALPAKSSTCRYPAIGVSAVVVGAIIAQINTRITTFALADVRGAMGFGFDEGSWLTTVFSVGQMLVTPAAAWFGAVLGTRRLLLWSTAIFTVSSLVLPLCRDYDTVIALQLVRGLSVGTFIPASLGFILRSLAPRWWIWGLAAYSFRFGFSQNIAASLEAWYSETGHWEWVFWQNVVLTPLMAGLIWIGMSRRPIDRELLRRTDWGGIVFAGLGFALIYAALDQGNRLDWLNSGMVTGLLLGGGLLVAAFIVNEGLAPFPLIHLPILTRRSVWIPIVLIAIFGFGSTATAFVLPDYLTRIQGLRALQIGDVLNWIALPQIVLVPLTALTLRWVDARILLAVGFALIAAGSWMDTDLTHDWANDDFLASQIVAAFGLAVALTALITFAVANIVPAQAAAIAAAIQTARLIGVEAGSAFIQTFVRVREQIHSHFIGLHLVAGSDAMDRAVDQASAPFSDRPFGVEDTTAAALEAIGNVVRREAYVLAYIDSFWVIAWVLAASLLLIFLLRPPPLNALTPPRRAV
jgi:DHA2 family multidrug resistance protein